MPKRPSNPKTWIRVSTAAKLKGVRRQTLYYHLKEGNLKSVLEMDGNTYLDRDEVLALKPKGKGEYRPRTKKTDEDDPESDLNKLSLK